MIDHDPYKPPNSRSPPARPPKVEQLPLGDAVSAPVFWLMFGTFWLLDLLLFAGVAVAVWTQRLPAYSWTGVRDGELTLSETPEAFLFWLLLLCAVVVGYTLYLVGLWSQRPGKRS